MFLIPLLVIADSQKLSSPDHITTTQKEGKAPTASERKDKGTLRQGRNADHPNIHSLSGGFYDEFRHSHPQPGPKYYKPVEPKYHEPTPKYHKPTPSYHSTPSYHQPTPKYKPAPTYHPAPQYKPEPSYHHSTPSYHEPSHEKSKTNCTVIDKTEEGEVCTPTLEKDCKQVVLTYKKVVLNEKCNTITTTKCNEVNEEEEIEICNYEFKRGRIPAKGKTVDVRFEKKQKTTYEEVCEKVQVYGKYGKEYEERCNEVPKKSSYNIPKVSKVNVDLKLYAPEPQKTCTYKRLILPRVVCEEVKEEKCNKQPELEDVEENFEVCQLKAGEPDCKRIKLELPEQHCEDIIEKPKSYHG